MLGRLLLLLLGLLTVVGSWFVTCQLWDYQEIASGVAWLEPREFETLTLITLGTGSAYENPNRLGPSSAIAYRNQIVLVDAGRGVAEALRVAEIPVSQPTAVFLTSLLPENTVGLDDLLFTGWIAPRHRSLRLVGPPGTQALADGLLRGHGRGHVGIAAALELPEAGGLFKVVEVEGAHFEERLEDIAVAAAPVAEIPLPQLAYRFSVGAKSIVVSGTGAEANALAEFADGAWVLAAEGFLQDSVDQAIAAGVDNPERLRREAALHRDLAEIGAVAQRAGVLGLVLTRLRPPPLFDRQFESPVAEHFEGRIAIANDGDEFRP